VPPGWSEGSAGLLFPREKSVKNVRNLRKSQKERRINGRKGKK